MILNLPLLAVLSGAGVTWAASSPNCLSGSSFDTCCSDRDAVGKGTVDGVVMNYACGTYAKDETVGFGTVHKGAANAKDCAGLCASDASCQAGFWSKVGSKCYLLNGNGYKTYHNKGTFLLFEKTTEDPGSVDECKDRVDSATSQCNAEKDKIKQQGLQLLQKCQDEKDQAITGAGSKCEAEKDAIRKENAQLAEQASKQCEVDKNQALTQAGSKCEAEKDAIRKENAQLAEQASKQCEADKDQLRQQAATAASEYEKKIADLQSQLTQCQANVPTAKPVPAIDPNCESNSWVNMCSSCSQDTFVIDGKEFKKKCGVRTVGAREEQWLYRASLIACMKECATRGDCLGVGWRPAEGINGMPTAQGEIKGDFNQFEGHWVVDGNSVQLRGNFSQSVEQFQSINATLEYDSTEDLVGPCLIDTAETPSHVGNTDVALSLVRQDGRKVKITGSLSFPIPGRFTLTGQGFWAIAD
ncbi:hypothetical protein COH20_006948 [Aspergillus flavus]|uniref:Apple domain-containing protein n=1 Tax=Aspergillus flavus TaxID=5059 RepID=A0AB74CEH5_ASPFL|nr:hypothetical protein COH21_003290 [Aspergillus flavus]RAQ65194.1 hypothetical protein COH20_006948 [Aspergillus flavus]RMZ44591.1 hypothetical protein CA14_012209 [Aspergillus flavus]